MLDWIETYHDWNEINISDIITCPHCEIEIAKVIKDIIVGSKISSKDVEGIYEPITKRSPLRCPKCGCDYIYHVKIIGGFKIIGIHTNQGWKKFKRYTHKRSIK